MSENVTKDNFRSAAQAAIAEYSKKGMIVDCFFWAQILRFYGERIAELEGHVATLQVELNRAGR